MDTNYDIGVKIHADSARGAARNIGLADSALNTFGRTAQTFSTSVTSMGAAYSSTLSGISSGNPVIAGATAAISGLAVAATQSSEALQRAASFDAARRGLIAVSDNAETAKEKLVELERVASDTQGLTFRQAVSAQRNLQAAKIEAGDATRSIKAFANALALVGGGDEEFKGVLTAMTQIASKSKISAEEINQLAERMPQIRSAMQNVYGTADTEVLQNKGIDPKDFLRDITAELEKLPKAQGSAIGGWENFTDSVDKAYVKLGEPALPTATRLLDKFSDIIDNNAETWTNWGRSLEKTLGYVEKMTDAVRYLSDGTLGKVASGLSDVAYYTNYLNLVFNAAATAIDNFDKASGNAGKSLTAVAKTDVKELIKAAPKTEAAYRAVNQTIKEVYDERLKGIDTFHKQALIKANAGINSSKNQELSHQNQLLSIEAASYQARLTALQKYYNERIAKARTAAEKEQLEKEGKTAADDITLDYQTTKANIERNIAGVQAAIKEQLRGDLSEGLQLQLDAASTTMQNTLEELANKFEKGEIGANAYWESAKKSMNSYNVEFYRLRKEQLDLFTKKDGLTQTQIDNEYNKATQQIVNAENEIKKAGRQLFDELYNYQAVNDRASADRLAETDATAAAASESILKYYQLLRDFPAFSDENMASTNSNLRNLTQQVKKEYADLLNDQSFNEQALLLLRQSAEETALTSKIEYLEKESSYYNLNKKKQAEINAQIAVEEEKLVALRAKNNLELLELQIEKKKEAAEVERTLNRDIADSAISSAQALLKLQTLTIEQGAAKGENLQAVYETSRLARQALLEELDAERDKLAADKTAALERVKNVQGEAELKSKINEAYRLKELGLEREYQEKLLEIAGISAGKRKEAADMDAAAGLSNRGAFGQGIFGDPVKIQSEAEYIKGVYRDLGATAGGIMQDMIGAGGQLLEQWILTGEAGGAAMAQLAASTIAAVAVQAGVKAIFETAEGFAAAARYDFVSAAGHFTAAKIYGAVALGAVATGLVIGAAGGLQGGSGSGGSSNANQPDYQTSSGSGRNIQTSPISAQASQDNARIAAAIEKLEGKLSSMRPEDVVTVGVTKKKGFISGITITEIKGNSTKKREMGKALNLK